MQDGELPPLQAGGDSADGCRLAGTARTGAEPTSSSRPDRRGLGPAEPPPQRVAKRRGAGTPAAVGRRGQGRRRTRALLLIFFVCESL